MWLHQQNIIHRLHYMVHLAYIDSGIPCIWVLNILSNDIKVPSGNFILENVLEISTNFSVKYYVSLWRNYIAYKTYFTCNINTTDISHWFHTECRNKRNLKKKACLINIYLFALLITPIVFVTLVLIWMLNMNL